MLVLSRKANESMQLGDDITVTILKIKGQSVKVGIDAPTHVHIWRDEVVSEPHDVGHRFDDHNPATRFEILLVEDSRVHARMVCDAVAACEHEQPIRVSVAPTPGLAIAALEAKTQVSPFDLILMDLYLPDTTGLELVRQLRNDPIYYLTPIVMFSSEDDRSAVRNCLEAGANAYVTKSRDRDGFCRSVRHICSFWANESMAPRPTSRQLTASARPR